MNQLSRLPDDRLRSVADYDAQARTELYTKPVTLHMLVESLR